MSYFDNFTISSRYPSAGTYIVGRSCMQSYPCQHNVVIIHENGNIRTVTIPSGKIKALMEKGNKSVEPHFL